MPIETDVEGDPASCRALALEVRTGGEAARVAGEDVYRARNTSEACWGGESAELFRTRMTEVGTGADQLAEFSVEVARATDLFADDLTTVQSRMEQARSVAAAAGLPVTGTVIGDPVPAPAPLPADGVTPEQIGVHTAAVADHQAQVAAGAEIATTVADARALETQAHQRLGDALGRQSAFLQYNVTNSGWTGWAFATGLAGASNSAVTRWRTLATAHAKRADKFGRIAGKVGISPAFRAGVDAVAGHYGGRAANAQTNRGSAERMLANVGRTKFGQAALDLATAAPGLHRYNDYRPAFETRPSGRFAVPPNRLQPIVRITSKLPYIGILTAGAQVETARWAGGDVGKAAWGAGTSFAAGALGTSAATTALVAAGMAAGPAGWVAVGVGTAVAVGVGFVVDEYGDEIAQAWDDSVGQLW